MAGGMDRMDVKLLVKHLANGSFGENLCRICLAPLTEFCENVFTSICREGKEYCIANVLREICDIQISDDDHYNVCPSCFTDASNAYKFYMNTKANDDLIHYYIDEMSSHIQSIDVPYDIKAESLCISLPAITMDYFDYNIKDVINYKRAVQKPSKEIELQPVAKVEIKEDQNQDDDEIVIVMNEKGQPTFFTLQPDNTLVKKTYDEKCRKAFEAIPKQKEPGQKMRKQREPLTVKKCSRCTISYRFVAKLKEHMKTEHDVILYACKICDALTEDLDEHQFHMSTHTSIYQCDICNVKFKKRDTILAHLKEHKDIGDGCVLKSEYVCILCGLILTDEDSLKSHVDLIHCKKYTCYYCGRMYKVITSFEKHIKKHEMYLKQAKQKQQKKTSLTTAEVKQLIQDREVNDPTVEKVKSLTCELCGRGFRGERALMWHSRLHTNERPFSCDVCGRSFVSLNRRNQHALCSHAAPARRCPLCPALFHLRSMVNSHIKKVHLKKHKRRMRTVRQPNVYWPTEPVPVQELAVALQSDILELQASRDNETEYTPEAGMSRISY